MKSKVLSFAEQKALTLKGLTFRSQDVAKGFVFFALKGAHVDGNLFIEEAIQRGAVLIVSDQQARQTYPVPYLQVRDIDAEMADAAYEFYGRPSDTLVMTGITGTKGKTSIAYLLESVLKESGRKVGVFGTVNYRMGGVPICAAPNTTPASLILFRLLQQMKAAKCEEVVMEVSSHSLELQRVRNIWYDTAVFTNLQRDHLDFHQTFENYFQAKVKLFENLADPRNPKKNRVAVINIDDPYGQRLARQLTGRVRIVTFGKNSPADFIATDIRETLRETHFKINGVPMKINLLGAHNVYNALAACAVAVSRGISIEIVAAGLAALSGVPGRMEQVCEGQAFTVFVDFAYTDESLQRALDTVAPFKTGKILLVFGCGGQRDRTKRPLMGHTACTKADTVFLTNDNPRCEDPQQIFKDILAGMKGQTNYKIIPDRKEAIEEALTAAQANDVVIIAGKGHEDYQLVGTEKRPFSDQETVRKFLREKKHV
ncbi:MAG: UDP-N-acetylmuramoyl-L-alanyl-D-glutamate--2,6-diaminopimelate ligase [Elusimicrobiaceae bacterium]|nr:UDP-N-acetylmuramoyl-L-alanyl-D-glutamate--2,6-diaminopimelate ligase [Elusimicrobiaceae bacterium]